MGGTAMDTSLFEDQRVEKRKDEQGQNQYSPYCDFIYYTSSRDPELRLAMKVIKPARPGYILAMTHGWHMSAEPFAYMEKPREDQPFLIVQVDMRGRAFSTGQPDCNGYELWDVIDAVQYARHMYAEYILDPEIVYFEAGSGGGGNAYAITGKFPDFFTAVNALYGISDYALWYEKDTVGEFRDEMDVWIGCSPKENPMAYAARSGITTVENLMVPLYIAHGETDVRVPSEHAVRYLEKAQELGKGALVEYYELKGVGTRSHLGNITPNQRMELERRARANLTEHTTPPVLPRKGKLIVAGYLVTKEFSIVLDSVDKTAELEYDLETERFQLRCTAPVGYTLERFRNMSKKV